MGTDVLLVFMGFQSLGVLVALALLVSLSRRGRKRIEIKAMRIHETQRDVIMGLLAEAGYNIVSLTAKNGGNIVDIIAQRPGR